MSSPVAIQGTGAGRMTAKSSLEDRIYRLRAKADMLEALLKAIPDLEGQADAALWQLICDSRS